MILSSSRGPTNSSTSMPTLSLPLIPNSILLVDGSKTTSCLVKGGGGGGSTAGYGYTTIGTIAAFGTGTASIKGYFVDTTSEDLGTHTLINTCSHPINGSGGCTRVNAVRPPDMTKPFRPLEFGEHDEDVYLVIPGLQRSAYPGQHHADSHTELAVRCGQACSTSISTT